MVSQEMFLGLHLILIQSWLTAQGPVVPGDTQCLCNYDKHYVSPRPPVQSTVTRLIKCSHIDKTTYPGAPENTLARWRPPYTTVIWYSAITQDHIVTSLCRVVCAPENHIGSHLIPLTTSCCSWPFFKLSPYSCLFWIKFGALFGADIFHR